MDATLVAVTYMELAYPKDLERAGEWRKMAETLGIEMEEDPELQAARRRKVEADLQSMFGFPDIPGTTVV